MARPPKIQAAGITGKTPSDNAALRDSEQRLRRMVNVEGVGVLLFDAVTGTLIDANDGFLHMSGYTREQVASHKLTWRTMTPPEFTAESEKQMEVLAATGRLGPYEKQYFNADGSRSWMLFTGTALGDGTAVEFCIDIGDRKRAEAALRASEARRAYLLHLHDALRPLADAGTIQNTAARVLGEHLGVSRAMYAEVAGGAGEEVGTLRGQYHAPRASESTPALAPFPDRYKYDSYGEWVMTLRRRGETMIVNDVVTDTRFNATEREAWIAGGVRAAVTVPLVKAGRFVGDFGVQSVNPREWTEGEISLVEATAEHTWAAVERARTEATLREREQKYRGLYEKMRQGYSEVEIVRNENGNAVDYRMLEMNPAFEHIVGVRIEHARGRLMSQEVLPGIDHWWAETFDRVARTGEPERVERYVPQLGRWYEVFAYPAGNDRLTTFFDDITERKRTAAIAERARFEAGRESLRRELAAAEEAERRRLARELHDQLGQRLTAFALGLEEAARLADSKAENGADERLRKRLASLQSLARAMTTDARFIALELRPPELDDMGLAHALETYVVEWSSRFGIEAEVETGNAVGQSVDANAASAMYRIAQEALTNVAKHADASHVSVVLDNIEGELRLVVEGDGCGFDVGATRERAARERRLGLASIEERATLAGAVVRFESDPGSGTAVFVRLPVNRG